VYFLTCFALGIFTFSLHSKPLAFMTDMFPKAVRLNNDGVQALVDHNEAIAVECFTKSIKTLKGELCRTAPCHEESSPFEKDVKEDASLFLAEKVVNSESSDDGANLHLTVALPDLQQGEQTFIFNKALTLSERSGCEGTPSVDDLKVSTATVVYNLALAYHRRGMNTGRAELLIKADKLYSMGLKLLSEDHQFTSRISIITKLASINNLTQLRFDAGDFDKACEGLQHLSHGFRVRSAYFLRGTAMKDLLMNVLLLTPPTVAPAA
jgi:tetratricopeptide (TPR) repeat protein